MDEEWVIYGLRVKGGTKYRYIGYSTITAEKRLQKHIYTARSERRLPVHRWIAAENYEVEVEVIEICPEGQIDYLYSREIFWICHYKNLQGWIPDPHTDDHLLNLTSGGGGAVGYRHTDEECKRRSGVVGYWAGKALPEEMKLKISEAHRGKPKTLETRARMSAAQLGKTHTEDTRAKISAKVKGQPNRGRHTRWHVQRGKIDDTCIFCTD